MTVHGLLFEHGLVPREQCGLPERDGDDEGTARTGDGQRQLTVDSKEWGASDRASVASTLEMRSTKESVTMKYLLQAG